MQKDEKQEPLVLVPVKEPIEMNSDELLDYVLAPELAEAVKREANPPEPENPEDC